MARFRLYLRVLSHGTYVGQESDQRQAGDVLVEILEEVVAGFLAAERPGWRLAKPRTGHGTIEPVKGDDERLFAVSVRGPGAKLTEFTAELDKAFRSRAGYDVEVLTRLTRSRRR